MSIKEPPFFIAPLELCKNQTNLINPESLQERPSTLYYAAAAKYKSANGRCSRSALYTSSGTANSAQSADSLQSDSNNKSDPLARPQ